MFVNSDFSDLLRIFNDNSVRYLDICQVGRRQATRYYRRRFTFWYPGQVAVIRYADHQLPTHYLPYLDRPDPRLHAGRDVAALAAILRSPAQSILENHGGLDRRSGTS